MHRSCDHRRYSAVASLGRRNFFPSSLNQGTDSRRSRPASFTEFFTAASDRERPRETTSQLPNATLRLRPPYVPLRGNLFALEARCSPIRGAERRRQRRRSHRAPRYLCILRVAPHARCGRRIRGHCDGLSVPPRRSSPEAEDAERHRTRAAGLERTIIYSEHQTGSPAS